MSNEDKNIYDLFNEVEFDTAAEVEIPINDIEKKKIKKIVKSKIKRRSPWKNKKLIASVACFIIVLLIISPMGRETIADMAEKFLFNPGLGLVNVQEELYVLNEPVIMEAENKEILIKGIVSNKEGLNIQLWINDESKNGLSKEKIPNFEDIRKFIHIKTVDGKELELTSINIAGGGATYFISAWIESDEIRTDLGIQVYDCYKEVVLNKIEDGSEFYNVGGSDNDNDFFIGGNKYIFEDKTYITLWSDEEYINNNMFYFGIDKENIKVTDLDGRSYEVYNSEYSGNSKEFVINEKIEKPLNIEINKVNLDYSLNEPIKLKLNIPKVGETVELNEEIYIEELDEKILLKYIKLTDEGIEVKFDSRKYKKEDTEIVILGQDRSSWAIGSSEDDRNINIGVYNEDLTLIERLTGEINLTITKVSLKKYGHWDFKVN